MGADSQDDLRLFVAELEAELDRLEALVSEFGRAEELLDAPEPETLIVYGSAALLESFYTGMEKALHRIATTLGGMPKRESWHRDLLRSMTLAIDGVRPRVLSDESARAVDAFLAFRHRFRNLYVFELENAPMRELLARGPGTLALFGHDLRAFVARLRARHETSRSSRRRCIRSSGVANPRNIPILLRFAPCWRGASTPIRSAFFS